MFKLLAHTLFLVGFLCIEAAPKDRITKTSHGYDSDSMSPESEGSPEETEEEASDYQDTQPQNFSDDKENDKREDLVRAMELPEVYGLPGSGNTDMTTPFLLEGSSSS